MLDDSTNLILCLASHFLALLQSSCADLGFVLTDVLLQSLVFKTVGQPCQDPFFNGSQSFFLAYLVTEQLQIHLLTKSVSDYAIALQLRQAEQTQTSRRSPIPPGRQFDYNASSFCCKRAVYSVARKPTILQSFRTASLPS